MSDNILEVRGLRKSYRGFSLDGVSFDLPKGFIMGFVGPNGAGKTTAIKLILNVINGGGEVKIFGGAGRSLSEPLRVSDSELLAHAAGAKEPNERIGIVMEAPMYVDDWTPGDVEAAVSPFYRQWDGGRFAGCLKRFGIDPKKKVKELSRGMKVKLQIAAALSHSAELLILDEPTSGLDPVARDEICDLLREFVGDENRGVLFSTHITTDLEKVADYITFILDGRIVFSGAKDALAEKYVMVRGGLGELSPSQKKLIMGLREHGSGFEGLAEAADAPLLPGGLLAERATLDEIIIHMSKGGGNRE